MSEPVPIRDHAADNLRYIREAMERASSFTSIPGWGGVAVGMSGIATAIIAQRFIDQPRTWLLIWLADAVVATIVAAATIVRKARRSGVSLTAPAARRFFVSYLAPIAAAAALTLVLVKIGATAAIPSTWLLLYGASFVSSGAFSIRVVPVMGLAFLFLGVISCFVPFAAANVLLGAGFGALHVIFGAIIARSYGG